VAAGPKILNISLIRPIKKGWSVNGLLLLVGTCNGAGGGVGSPMFGVYLGRAANCSASDGTRPVSIAVCKIGSITGSINCASRGPLAVLWAVTVTDSQVGQGSDV
jgi:hypothetical protein